MEKVQNAKKISWVDLSDEELIKICDITVCMYNKPPVEEGN